MKKIVKSIVILALIMSLALSNASYAESGNKGIINDEIISGNVTIAERLTEESISEIENPVIQKLADITSQDVNNAVNKFSDMASHWSREYVGKLALLEIIAGYPDGRFGPEDTLKVDEFLKKTLRAMGHKVEEGVNYWAEPYIKLAKEEGIIEENEYTDYRRPIRREEAARIIIKALLKYEEAPIPNHVSYAKQRIPDYKDIGDEYKQEVLYAYSMGIITGTGGNVFMPKKTLTRGEGSAIIMRFLDKSMRKPLRPADSEIATITTTYNQLTYDIYPPSKPEVIDMIRLMQSNMSKSKGYPLLGYNVTDDAIYIKFYKSKESFEESSIFIDCIFTIRMAEWELQNYEIVVSKPENTKELHRDVFVEFFTYIFGKDAERVIKDFDEFIELSIKGIGGVSKRYTLNNREVWFTKNENNSRFSLTIDIL